MENRTCFNLIIYLLMNYIIIMLRILLKCSLAVVKSREIVKKYDVRAIAHKFGVNAPDNTP